MKATLKIILNKEDISDGLLEKISDAVHAHGIEDWHRPDLTYTISSEGENELIERVDAFKQAMWEFFDDCEIVSCTIVRYEGRDYDAEDFTNFGLPVPPEPN